MSAAMESKDRIAIALMAGNLAKSALDMQNTESASFAKLQLRVIAAALQQLIEHVEKIQA